MSQIVAQKIDSVPVLFANFVKRILRWAFFYRRPIKNNKIHNRWRRCNRKAKPEQVLHHLYKTYRENKKHNKQTHKSSHALTPTFTPRNKTTCMSRKQQRNGTKELLECCIEMVPSSLDHLEFFRKGTQ